MAEKHYNISNRKALTFRVRMSAKMANDIIKYSDMLGFNKSRFIRLAIDNLITEMKVREEK